MVATLTTTGMGRFLSEDKTLEKINWYLYGSKDPVSKKDFSGNGEITGDSDYMVLMLSLGKIALVSVLMLESKFMVPSISNEKMAAIGLVVLASFWMFEAAVQTSYDQGHAHRFFVHAMSYIGIIATILAGWGANAKWNKFGGALGSILVELGVAYSVTIPGLIISQGVEGE